MSIGLAAGILLVMFIMDELSYDKFHEKSDRIYKVVTTSEDGGLETNAWPVAKKIEDEIPEVEATTYSKKAHSSMMVSHEGKRYQHDLFYADNNFFKIFSFNFLQGSAQTSLKNPYSIVITKEIKDRYFPNEIVLGRTLTLRDTIDFTITGVIETVPSQSHIQFDMLASFATYEKLTPSFSYSEGWGNFNVINYALLAEGADIEQVRYKVSNIYRDNIGDWMKELGVDFQVGLVPLKDVYLKSSLSNSFGPSGSIEQLKMVGVIGIFIVLLACINFVNITTARSVYRAREIGIRKLSGSSKSMLFGQFISETFLLVMASLLFALLIIELSLPLFNELIEKNYQFNSIFSFEVVAGTAGLVLFMTLAAGFYPAIILSGMKSAEAIKGKVQTSKRGVQLRRMLVIAQFGISASLVLGTIIIIYQLNFMRDQDLGFSKDQVLVVDVKNVPRSVHLDILKNKLSSLGSVQSVSLTNALPGKPGWQGQWAYRGDIESNDPVDTEYMAIDENYIQTLDLELVAGRNFNLNNPAELASGLIINESTVYAMGWLNAKDAIGKNIVSPSKLPEGTVIGVIKDYHGLGLQHKIWPKAMDFSSDQYGIYYAIRFTTGNTSELLEQVQNEWHNVYSDHGFDYFFLDQEFEKQYRAEDRLVTLFALFAVIGIIIACIGLLGMVSFMVNTRIKEISIRKIHGASVNQITGLLSKEFMFLVVISNLVVIGPVWYFAKEWLNDFAYHTNISPSIFMINLGIMVVLAFLTVSIQIIRAAMSNPAQLLHDD
jgi:putative ABC transport system permease protein